MEESGDEEAYRDCINDDEANYGGAGYQETEGTEVPEVSGGDY